MGRAHEVRKVAMAKTAAKKAKLYSRYGKENLFNSESWWTRIRWKFSIKTFSDKAKKEQVPADVIKRAIDKVKSGVN